MVALFALTLCPWSSLWTENKFEAAAFFASRFVVEEDALVCRYEVLAPLWPSFCGCVSVHVEGCT